MIKLSNVYADWLKIIEFVLKMEFLMRVTAKLPKPFPHIQHRQMVARLLRAVTIRLPAPTVNVHFPILEIYHPELLVSQTIVTQVTTRKLSELC
jgi:hypothetical protein